MKHSNKHHHPFLQVIRHHRVEDLRQKQAEVSQIANQKLPKPDKSVAQPSQKKSSLSLPQKSGGIANQLPLRAPEKSSFVAQEQTIHQSSLTGKTSFLQKPEKAAPAVLVSSVRYILLPRLINPPSQQTSIVENEQALPDESSPLVTGALATGESFFDGRIDPAMEGLIQIDSGEFLPQVSTDLSLVSSLDVLLNQSFSFNPEILNFFLGQAGISLSTIVLSDGILQTQLSSNELSFLTSIASSPEFASFVEVIAGRVSLLGLSVGLSNTAQLSPAQTIGLALAHSLGLSSQQIQTLLNHLAHFSSVSAKGNFSFEQSHLVNPFIQGMILNHPAAFKGFLSELFSPVLRTVLSLFFAKELNFSPAPSTLLAELSALMARSAQRRKRRHRNRVTHSDRVARKDPSVFAGIDPHDEEGESKDEIELWDQLNALYYPERETSSFQWN